MIVKLEPYEIEMASQVANKRYVENIKMKTFGHGFKGTEENIIFRNYWGNGLVIVKVKMFFLMVVIPILIVVTMRLGKDIEIRTQQRKQNNTLIIRPIGGSKYVLITYDGNHTYTIQGSFPYFTKLDDKPTDFGLDRPKQIYSYKRFIQH